MKMPTQYGFNFVQKKNFDVTLTCPWCLSLCRLGVFCAFSVTEFNHIQNSASKSTTKVTLHANQHPQEPNAQINCSTASLRFSLLAVCLQLAYVRTIMQSTAMGQNCEGQSHCAVDLKEDCGHDFTACFSCGCKYFFVENANWGGINGSWLVMRIERK